MKNPINPKHIKGSKKAALVAFHLAENFAKIQDPITEEKIKLALQHTGLTGVLTFEYLMGLVVLYSKALVEIAESGN